MPNSCRFLFSLCAVLLLIPSVASAQSTNATITGQVADPSKAVLPQATVRAINNNTNVRYESQTNQSGTYLIPSLPPGDYRVEVEKTGFKTVIKPDIVLHVQDTVELNFEMAVGSTTESVTVEGGAPIVDTQDATVSTVVDRRFVENMPLNGRSFQTLISLTPGVVATPTSFNEPGQFSVNGQRADSNYFMVDGVSANVGTSAGSGLVQGMGGALPGFSALGSTSSLVSVDAMQEFRIQTSTFAPEFGRTPGAQVSIITRSGTNQFHGTAFDYFRNDAMDAADWFANHNHLPKSKDRQNDFGGILAGPVLKDHTFFLFSYEGLRLRQPSFQTTFVPDLTARQAAPDALKPILNSFPIPNGPEVAGALAQFAASFSSPASLDAYSVRIDQVVGSKLSLFGRYNYAPSELDSRGGGLPLSVVQHTPNTVHTLTVGLTAAISPTFNNDLRINYSNAMAGTTFTSDNFGGAAPLTSSAIQFPAGDTLANSLFRFGLTSNGIFMSVGKNVVNESRQVNAVDNVSILKGTHQIKWGVDYRWLAPFSSPLAYSQVAFFSGLTGANGALAGKGASAFISSFAPAALLVRNLSFYGQDTWKASQRLTITYGVRWDINPAVEGKNDRSSPLALTNVNNPAILGVASPGSPLYHTRFANFAPRVGAAYRLGDQDQWATVVRGGFGIFYDLGSGYLGALTGGSPFLAQKSFSNIAYPFTPAQIAPPVISAAPPYSSTNGADPNLATPRTYQWNASLEQALGSRQMISLSYIGAAGRDLLRADTYLSPNPTFSSAVFITRSNASSDYNALQARFQRQLVHGLQAMASYTWSHSIDVASNDSGQLNTPINIGVRLDRGNSDFDIRHAASGALSYDIPLIGRTNHFGRAIASGWSVEDLVIGRSATPITVLGNPFLVVAGTEFAARPNVVTGVPLYVYGSQFPGGRALNGSAFSSATGGTQGSLPRNALRGFGAWQDDFTVRRQFHLTEKIGLQFRAEFFNVLNHPNFGNPVATLTSSNFGQAAQTLAKTLSPGGIGAGLNPLYQIGGPRSIQLALKLSF